MINFENFAMSGAGPIYMQIIMFIKRGVAAGTIRDRDEMPSRRVLSSLLGVNPNTVQKAYRILEEEGLIESRAGAGSFVTLDAGTMESVRRELLEEETGAFVRALRQAGLGKEEAMRLIDAIWESGEEK